MLHLCKNLKNVCLLVLVWAMLLSLSACGVKEPMSGEEFVNSMEKLGLTVTDETEEAANDSFEKVYVAVDKEKYSFEYYICKSGAHAQGAYKYAVDNVKNLYGNTDNIAVEHNNPIQSSYALTAEDYFVEIILLKNTVLFVTAYPDYKTESGFIIQKMGF